jgi:hypothetical protein
MNKILRIYELGAIGHQTPRLLHLRFIYGHIAPFAHRPDAAIAGIKMILAGIPFHEFLPAGDADPFGRGLVGLEFGHNCDTIPGKGEYVKKKGRDPSPCSG